MLERQIINGQSATVAYLSTDFKPVDKGDAELVKIIFDNGDSYFVTPKRPK